MIRVFLAQQTHAFEVTIAVAIALEFGSTAGLFEVRDALITLLNVRAVQTFVLLEVFVLFGTATVTTIPVATRIVTAKIKKAWEEW